MKVKFVFDRGVLNFTRNIEIIPRIGEKIIFNATTQKETKIERFIYDWEAETGCCLFVLDIYHTYNDNLNTIEILLSCNRDDQFLKENR